jgi:predicted adenine nucleotide alpha hydrolase (AANH) superfamily ATPase
VKLLLHACCAPCSLYCAPALESEGSAVTLFWHNPNIHPYTEYRSRLDSLRLFAKKKELPLKVEDEYGLRFFIKAVTLMDLSRDLSMDLSDLSIEENPSNPGLRCAYCYRLRLEKTARLAAEGAYDSFSTSLLISPYQNHELIRQIGEEFGSVYGVEFLYRDFRPFYREGKNKARQAGYYMQKYCGCIYSEEERYLKLPGPSRAGI